MNDIIGYAHIILNILGVFMALDICHDKYKYNKDPSTYKLFILIVMLS